MARRVYYPPPRDPRWSYRALCSDVSPHVMAPHEEDAAGVDRARAICGNCPVLQDCLTSAMGEEGSDEPHLRDGMRGGHTPAERYTAHRRSYPRRRKPAELKPCGTRAGYDRHRARGEEPCGDCRDAMVEEQRVRRAAARAGAVA